MKTDTSFDESVEILNAATETYDFAQALTAGMAVPTAAQSFVLTVAAVASSMRNTSKADFLQLASEIWDQIGEGPSPSLLN